MTVGRFPTWWTDWELNKCWSKSLIWYPYYSWFYLHHNENTLKYIINSQMGGLWHCFNMFYPHSSTINYTWGRPLAKSLQADGNDVRFGCRTSAWDAETAHGEGGETFGEWMVNQCRMTAEWMVNGWWVDLISAKHVQEMILFNAFYSRIWW